LAAALALAQAAGVSIAGRNSLDKRMQRLRKQGHLIDMEDKGLPRLTCKTEIGDIEFEESGCGLQIPVC
jgi:hypothetical protein